MPAKMFFIYKSNTNRNKDNLSISIIFSCDRNIIQVGLLSPPKDWILFITPNAFTDDVVFKVITFMYYIYWLIIGEKNIVTIF